MRWSDAKNGEKVACPLFSSLAEWQRRFPDAEVHSYPDCGHYILEDAKEEVVPVIREFLERTEA